MKPPVQRSLSIGYPLVNGESGLQIPTSSRPQCFAHPIGRFLRYEIANRCVVHRPKENSIVGRRFNRHRHNPVVGFFNVQQGTAIEIVDPNEGRKETPGFNGSRNDPPRRQSSRLAHYRRNLQHANAPAVPNPAVRILAALWGDTARHRCAVFCFQSLCNGDAVVALQQSHRS